MDLLHNRLTFDLGDKVGKFWILSYYGRKCVTNLVTPLRQKYKSTQNLPALHASILRTTPHFATEFCNFTNFSMLFSDVVIYFPLVTEIES